MAELLIYSKIHWMDKLTAEQVTERISDNPNFEIKYNSRYQQGDIIEIRKDGYWSDRGFNKDAFVVIKIIGLGVDNKYVESFQEQDGIDENDNPIMTTLKRRKWRIRKEDLPTAVKQELIETGMYITTKTIVQTYLHNKVG